MSKIIYVCLNNYKYGSSLKKDLELISNEIMPDNITASQPKIIDNEGIIFGIFNPNDSILMKNNSVCLGSIFGKSTKWWEPMQEYPDGSYALFRGNRNFVEVVSDVVASRTIWYFKNDDIFITSTSQRAIIFLLRSFNFNEVVIPWMLCNGNLGPSNSWDSRFKCLPGDSSLILDRQSWKLTKKVNRVSFSTLDKSNQEYDKLLSQALKDTFEYINLDYSKWVLPLSGGFDSRGILCMLKDTDRLKTITWGLRSSLSKKDNDAFIAKSLANFFNLRHKYYETDLSDEPIESIFDRFLVCGEGRIDHISGYMDGFKIWKTLFENKIYGIIRGDEGFGWVPVSSPLDVRRTIAISLWEDFSNLKSLKEFCFTEQKMPSNLHQEEGETLAMWRDRLYHQFRIPVVLAALNDLKLNYVEIINPLLSRRIIYQVRGLPDHLRTNKNMYRKIIRSISPKIDIAKYPALESRKDIFKSKRVIELLKEELSSNYVDSILPKEFINYIFDHLEIFEETNRRKNRSLLNTIKNKMPQRLKNILLNTILGQSIDFNSVAFRAYIICRMNKMLTKDAKSLD